MWNVVKLQMVRTNIQEINRYGDTIIFVYILDIIVLEYTKIETKSDISLLVVESWNVTMNEKVNEYQKLIPGEMNANL